VGRIAVADRTQSLGFVGLGAMGSPIARRLIKAGHPLVVFDVEQAEAGSWEGLGARFAASAADVAAGAGIVFLSLPGPREVEAVVLGPSGLMEGAQAGDVIVDLSTNAFATVTALALEAARSGVAFVDAPVSGGVAGAVKGTLAVMAGGEASAVERVTPLMSAFAANVFPLGASGMGSIAKLVNNQIFLTASAAVQEGFVLAAKAGLDSARMLEILKASSAAGYVGLAPLFLRRGFDNVTFKLALAAKDLDVALQSARALGVPMPASQGAATTYHDAIAKGLGEQVFFATLRVLEEDARTEVAQLAKP
jgi:3-hydroxyisobutyrate dehydrogenase-like beta-hydroxyacid dehydrogenase